MITPDEMKAIARGMGVDPLVIEKDYVQNWFLKSIYSSTDTLIFKGGTAIKKAFIKDYRFSDDLDFTMSKEMSQKEVESLIGEAKSDVYSEIGFTFTDEIQIKEVKSGWKGKIQYSSKISGKSMNLLLDLTHHNREVILTPVEKHPIFHNFNDSCEVDLVTYSLSEITAEKLRALCERGYPRDLYDVNNLLELVEKDSVSNIFLKKCEFKGFEPTLAAYDENYEEIKNAWLGTLKHQFKDVPDFEKAFAGARGILISLGL